MTAPGRTAARLAAGALVAAYCWWAAGLPGFSWWAATATALPGAIAVVAVFRRERGASDRVGISRSGAVAWTAAIGATLLWELVQYVSAPRSAHPTLSAMTDALLEPRPARALAFAVWLGCGWALTR